MRGRGQAPGQGAGARRGAGHAQSLGFSASSSWCAWYTYLKPWPAERSGISRVNMAKPNDEQAAHEPRDLGSVPGGRDENLEGVGVQGGDMNANNLGLAEGLVSTKYIRQVGMAPRAPARDGGCSAPRAPPPPAFACATCTLHYAKHRLMACRRLAGG